MLLSGARWTALALLAAALAALWQALKLSTWSFDGPGPGLYPQIIASFCAVLALIVLVTEGARTAPASGDEGVERYDTAAPAERRVFHVYLLALGILVAGTYWGGFTLTSFLVVLVIMRLGEGITWARSLTYALACTLFGLVCFGWLLRVGLPEGPLDHALYSLLR